MKLIVMVPCWNEEATLPLVIDSIPETVRGVDRIETLIVDDGSSDRTVEVARSCGVDHIVKLKQHRGLAAAFQAGIDACLDLGADIIVNTDGDNQYPSTAIPDLVEPVLTGKADIAIGDRQTQTIGEFSPLKKLLQRFGSWTVRKLAGAPDVRDAVSGFRAYSRYAAARIYLTSSYSYTVESVIQAGKRGLRIVSVPITTNAKTRPSRLYRSLPGFLVRSITTIVRSYAMYEPMKIFSTMGALSFLAGIALGGRFVYFLVAASGEGHIQSLVLAGSLLTGGLVLVLLGILADLIAANRRMLEELVWREKAGRRGLLESTLGNGTANGAVAELLAASASIEDERLVPRA